MQRSLGAATEVLDPAALRARFPWLETEGVSAGSFGPRDEGFFDNMGLLSGMKNAARAAPIVENTLNTHALGMLLYDRYFLAFQLAGLILLVAMIGAILLTLRHRRDIKRLDVLQQMWRDAGRGGTPRIIALAGKPDAAQLESWDARGVTDVVFGLPDRSPDEVRSYLERLAAKLGH